MITLVQQAHGVSECHWCGFTSYTQDFDVYTTTRAEFGRDVLIRICGKRIGRCYAPKTLARLSVGGCKAWAESHEYEYRDDLTKQARAPRH